MKSFSDRSPWTNNQISWWICNGYKTIILYLWSTTSGRRMRIIKLLVSFYCLFSTVVLAEVSFDSWPFCMITMRYCFTHWPAFCIGSVFSIPMHLGKPEIVKTCLLVVGNTWKIGEWIKWPACLLIHRDHISSVFSVEDKRSTKLGGDWCSISFSINRPTVTVPLWSVLVSNVERCTLLYIGTWTHDELPFTSFALKALNVKQF